MTNLGLPPGDGRRTASPSSTPPVGDRYVLEAMEAGGFALGGEQSGHVIQRDLATTGDGLLTGVHLADVVARTGRPLAELAAVMTRLPQVLRNVRLGRDRRADLLDRVAGRPSPPPRPSWATAAGCCCARAAPSRWSG